MSSGTSVGLGEQQGFSKTDEPDRAGQADRLMVSSIRLVRFMRHRPQPGPNSHTQADCGPKPSDDECGGGLLPTMAG
jgi:hypothetical protein